MAGSKIGEYTGKNFATLAKAGVGHDDLLLDVEDHTEKVTMVGPGATAALSHGPLVRNNLVVFRSSDNFAYTLGLDYLEDASGGIVNIRIAPGEVVRAEYFYHTEGALGTGGGGVFSPGPKVETEEDTQAASGAAASGVRIATMLKLGA